MEPPITIRDGFFPAADDRDMEQMWHYLELQRFDASYSPVPRFEAWFNDVEAPYTYGAGNRARTYLPRRIPWVVSGMMDRLNNWASLDFNCWFVNGCVDQKDHLGWHADDSPEMDTKHPIAIVSIGADREIWFKPIGGTSDDVTKVPTENGRMIMMHATMQEAWLHRIPKGSRSCGPRISFTFRRILAVD